MAGKRKVCPSKWINEQTLMEAYTDGEAYYGTRQDVLTTKGTVRKAIVNEARCHGLKLDMRRRGGYDTEVFLVPRVRGSKIAYPIRRRRIGLSGVHCRDSQGIFVPVPQCRRTKRKTVPPGLSGVHCRDSQGEFVPVPQCRRTKKK